MTGRPHRPHTRVNGSLDHLRAQMPVGAVGHAWQSRFTRAPMHIVRAAGEGRWKALCGRVGRCTREFDGTVAAVTCNRCLHAFGREMADAAASTE